MKNILRSLLLWLLPGLFMTVAGNRDADKGQSAGQSITVIRCFSAD
ncbi:MAG: hypothetical protein R2795_09190 [Saprospiraceae bacterium]